MSRLRAYRDPRRRMMYQNGHDASDEKATRRAGQGRCRRQHSRASRAAESHGHSRETSRTPVAKIRRPGSPAQPSMRAKRQVSHTTPRTARRTALLMSRPRADRGSDMEPRKAQASHAKADGSIRGSSGLLLIARQRIGRSQAPLREPSRGGPHFVAYALRNANVSGRASRRRPSLRMWARCLRGRGRTARSRDRGRQCWLEINANTRRPLSRSTTSMNFRCIAS